MSCALGMCLVHGLVAACRYAMPPSVTQMAHTHMPTGYWVLLLAINR